MGATLRIDTLAHGGDGVARLEGRAVFVPGTAPGDLVEAELVPGRANPLRATLSRVVEPGPGRVRASCPKVGECGGCQWQHLSPEAQLEAKRETLAQALRRLGKIPSDELPEIRAIAAPLARRYRRRARLALGPGWALGLFARGSRRIVPVFGDSSGCELLTEPLEAAVRRLGSALLEEPVPGLAHVEICEAGRASAELVLGEGAPFEPAVRAATRLLERLDGFAGLVVRGGERRRALAEPALWDGEALLRPDVFAQASREGNRRLVDEALGALSPRPGERLLELYCGSGNFTFSLARAAGSVVAVEEEGVALELARRATPAELESRVEWVASRVESFRPVGSFDAVLLDPPRAGARGAVRLLGGLGARRIAYVSCDPATLARDVGELVRLGHRVASAAVLDLYPQTYHLEAVVGLERRAA